LLFSVDQAPLVALLPCIDLSLPPKRILDFSLSPEDEVFCRHLPNFLCFLSSHPAPFSLAPVTPLLVDFPFRYRPVCRAFRETPLSLFSFLFPLFLHLPGTQVYMLPAFSPMACSFFPDSPGCTHYPCSPPPLFVCLLFVLLASCYRYVLTLSCPSLSSFFFSSAVALLP